MDLISSRYRKPKKRTSKKTLAGKQNYAKRFKTNDVDCKSKQSTLCCSDDKEVDNHSLSGDVSQIPNFNPEYTIMSNQMWSSLLSDIICTGCGEKNLDVQTKYTYGFSSNLRLLCKSCGLVCGTTFSSCRESISRKFTVNNKFVSVFLAFGKGHAALEVMAMMLGIPAMDKKTFQKYFDAMFVNLEETKQSVLEASWCKIKEHYNNNLPQNVHKNYIDICVTYDGTWHRRGHTSLYGIVIDIATGLVVDYEVLSKYCPECIKAEKDLRLDSPEFAIWFEGHKDSCQKNFTGSSNSMETCAAEILWKRSINFSKFRYISMLSDGDSKSFNHLNNINVYGKDFTLVKQECINHVAKRLGKALHDKVQEWKVKGITLGGKKRGNLTEETIRRLQNYYRKAIKENAPDVNKMKTAILASLYHCMSTDEKPQHSKCPEGISSWCFYQRALSNKESPPKHSTMKTHLSEKVVEKIFGVYQRLISTELLSRCTLAATQNLNESLHSCIWRKFPKEVFASKKRLDLSVLAAVNEFNFGCKDALKLANPENHVNDISVAIADKKDKRRSVQKNVRSTPTYKLHRNKKKFFKARANAKNVKKEETTYNAGTF